MRKLPVYVCTLYRPWCWAIAHRDKRVENRDFVPGWRPPWYLAIRSGKTWDSGGLPGRPEPEEWPAGRVVAIAQVVKHLRPGEGPGEWRNLESWGWELGHVATLREPIVWPPPEVLARRERMMKGLVLLEATNYVYDARLLSALRAAWRDSLRAA